MFHHHDENLPEFASKIRWFFYVRERPHVRGLTPGRVNPDRGRVPSGRSPPLRGHARTPTQPTHANKAQS
eukprot:scaffold5693_cov141-Skeletonema_menzelii.AAC.4